MIVCFAFLVTVGWMCPFQRPGPIRRSSYPAPGSASSISPVRLSGVCCSSLLPALRHFSLPGFLKVCPGLCKCSLYYASSTDFIEMGHLGPFPSPDRHRSHRHIYTSSCFCTLSLSLLVPPTGDHTVVQLVFWCWFPKKTILYSFCNKEAYAFLPYYMEIYKRKATKKVPQIQNITQMLMIESVPPKNR